MEKSGLCPSFNWNGWDTNWDGLFTISDVAAYFNLPGKFGVEVLYQLGIGKFFEFTTQTCEGWLAIVLSVVIIGGVAAHVLGRVFEFLS